MRTRNDLGEMILEKKFDPQSIAVSTGNAFGWP